MSIFGNIMSAIFSHASSVVSTLATPPPAAAQPASPIVQPSSAPGQGAPPPSSAPSIDVSAILDKLASQAAEKLDWRRSIVDLMKLINLDSSIQARTQLAKELNYTGNTNDSASMNLWLHKEVMTKLAQNGGKVPEELKH
jgi:Domain of unknown function (DUF3597)